MERGRRNRVGVLAMELAPAALFNFAAAFAVASLLRQAGFVDYAAPASVATGILAFLVAWQIVRRAGRSERSFSLPGFESALVSFDSEEFADLDELLLTEVLPGRSDLQQSVEGELLLNDIVECIGPASRVVQLFDTRAMPTAGELQARIDRHLRSGTAPAAASGDATHELHEAIAALRQSLR